LGQIHQITRKKLHWPRKEFKVFKKLQLVQNDELDINQISEEGWITCTKLQREDKAQRNLDTPHYEDLEKSNPIEETITTEELNLALTRSKNRKSPGLYNLIMELFKYGGDTMKDTLLSLFNDVWERHQIPEDWETGLVINIYKKGSKPDCKNYRCITLLLTASKIFANIIK
jgi:hypothetical protein